MSREFINNTSSEPKVYIFAVSTTENGRIIVLTAVLLIYLIVLGGNLLILLLICLEPQLHTSMYFFLCNLSTLDILYVSTTLPKLIYVSHTGDHIMSYPACLAQLYLYVLFADTESFLLTAMAIDRYVAVCFPLHYALIMNKKVCMLLTFPAWFMSVVNASIITWLCYNLKFLALIKIQNFFCDFKVLLPASLSDTSILKTIIFAESVLIGVIPFSVISASYICIIYTISKIKSSDGRWKTFSSCTSHITVVFLYFASAMSFYMQKSPERDAILSMLFVTLVPVLNPLIYSLRNKDITRAIRTIIYRKRTCLM